MFHYSNVKYLLCMARQTLFRLELRIEIYPSESKSHRPYLQRAVASYLLLTVRLPGLFVAAATWGRTRNKRLNFGIGLALTH